MTIPELYANGVSIAIDRLSRRLYLASRSGHFSFTVVDLEIPVSGIPIRVTRTYDARRRFEDLDFGYGWSVGYQDVNIDESHIPGAGWMANEYPIPPLGLLTRYCVEPIGKPIVAVILPDRRVERFAIQAAHPCSDVSINLDHELIFVAEPGTHATLELAQPVSVRYFTDESCFDPVTLKTIDSGHLADAGSPETVYNPDHPGRLRLPSGPKLRHHSGRRPQRQHPDLYRQQKHNMRNVLLPNGVSG